MTLSDWASGSQSIFLYVKTFLLTLLLNDVNIIKCLI
jgi:hypothetical protein